jgi:hypothetical protein
MRKAVLLVAATASALLLTPTHRASAMRFGNLVGIQVSSNEMVKQVRCSPGNPHSRIGQGPWRDDCSGPARGFGSVNNQMYLVRRWNRDGIYGSNTSRRYLSAGSPNRSIYQNRGFNQSSGGNVNRGTPQNPGGIDQIIGGSRIKF